MLVHAMLKRKGAVLHVMCSVQQHTPLQVGDHLRCAGLQSLLLKLPRRRNHKECVTMMNCVTVALAATAARMQVQLDLSRAPILQVPASTDFATRLFANSPRNMCKLTLPNSLPPTALPVHMDMKLP